MKIKIDYMFIDDYLRSQIFKDENSNERIDRLITHRNEEYNKIYEHLKQFDKNPLKYRRLIGEVVQDIITEEIEE